MGRPIRIEYPGALYHITSRGNERKKIFLDEMDRTKFLGILADYHNRYGILIHAYVLIDNHYHLILETPKGNLLRVMHGLNGSYTGYFNRKYGRVGHLFQGRYKAILIEKDTYLLPLSRYIHLNPARGGRVKRLDQYQWSSYRGYVGRENEQAWMEYGWILSQFSRRPARARRRYQEYVEEGLRQRIDSPLRDVHGQVILGTERFVEQTKGLLRGKVLSTEIVERGRFQKHPGIEEIVGEVARRFGVKHEVIRRRGTRGNTARQVALYLSHRYTGLGNEAIGRYFGVMHSSGVSKASARVKEEMLKNKRLASLVENIASTFKA
jgi:REP element-mobilizing transposase RayT